MSRTIDLSCKDCDERTTFERRKGVPLGSGASRWRCTECGGIR